MRRIKFHTTKQQNLCQNIPTVPGICFILVTFRSEFGAILDDKPI